MTKYENRVFATVLKTQWSIAKAYSGLLGKKHSGVLQLFSLLL